MEERFCARCEADRPAEVEECAECGSRLVTREQWEAEDKDSLLGAVIEGRYVILGKLGAGGMGSVYKGEQTAMGREVAIKMLRKDIGEDTTLVERFHREAKNSSKLEHPNTVRVFDFGKTAEGDLYLVMELLRGRSLGSLIAHEEIPPKRAVHIARQIARSVAEAHNKGLVHRDLKPGNVQIMPVEGDEDFVKVLDFGLAKLTIKEEEGDQSLTTAGAALGTPLYMSPEQCTGQKVDARADIYALGVILFELLAGRPPFVGESSVVTLTMHIRDPVPALKQVNPDLDAPPALQQIIFRCMEKDPDNRFASMEEVVRTLDMAMDPALAAAGSLPGMPAFPGQPPAPGMQPSAPQMMQQASAPGAQQVSAPLDPSSFGMDQTCVPESGQLVPTVAPPGAALDETMGSDPAGQVPGAAGVPPGMVSQPGVPQGQMGSGWVTPQGVPQGQMGSGVVSQPGVPQGQMGSGMVSQPGVPQGQMGSGMVSYPGVPQGQMGSGMVSLPGTPPSQLSSAVAGELAARSGIMSAPGVVPGSGGRKGLLAVVAVVLLAAAGGGAWFFLGKGDKPPPPPAEKTPKPATPPPKAVEPPKEEAKPAAKPLLIRVKGKPSGSSVKINGRLAGSVPTEYEFRGDTKTIKVEVERKGYQPFVKELGRDAAKDGVLEVKVKLRRAKKRGGKRKPSGGEGYEEFDDDSYEEF